MYNTPPIILEEGDYTAADIKKLRKRHKIWQEHDIYKQQLEELYEIDHPQLLDSTEYKMQRKKIQEKQIPLNGGNWIYFPWNGHLIHTLKENDYFRLRTNRNQNLVTTEEQSKLYNSCVLVAGLSVGNSIATTLAYAGIAKQMILADFDKIETANLNRLKVGLHEIGKPKITAAAEQIYEIDPYAQLKLYPHGIKQHDLEKFKIDEAPQIIFDEIDDFEMKVRLRLFAREHSLPLIMLTSLGDNILIDIERYDSDKNQKPFQGIVPESVLQKILTGEVSEYDKIKYAVQLVGENYIPTRALGSLLEIRKTLVGRPQLASTIAMDGGIATLLVKMLFLDQPLSGGQYYVDLRKLLTNQSDVDMTDERTSILKAIHERIKG